MLSKQFRYIPYIFFFVSIFDNVVLTFGVENFGLRLFITRVLQIAEIYFIGLTLLYVKQNYVILKEKRMKATYILINMVNQYIEKGKREVRKSRKRRYILLLLLLLLLLLFRPKGEKHGTVSYQG